MRHSASVIVWPPLSAPRWIVGSSEAGHQENRLQMNKFKPYLVTLVVAIVAMALVFRVFPPKVRQAIVGG